MKLFLFLIFNILFTLIGFSKEVVIKLSLVDCINCVKYLNDVRRIMQDAPVTFILESKYEPDAALIEKKYALHLFNHTKIFSDNAYYGVDSSNLSQIQIIENGVTIYKEPFMHMNIESFRQQYTSMPQPFICLPQDANPLTIYTEDFSTVVTYNTQLNKITLYDYSTDTTYNLIADSSWLINAYKSIFKSSYAQEYAYLQKIKELNPMLDLKLGNVKFQGDYLFILAEVPALGYVDSINKKIEVAKFVTLFRYNYKSHTWMNPLWLDQSAFSKEYYLFYTDKFLIKDKALYISIGGYKTTEASAVIAKYNFIGDSIVFDSILDFSVPENYVRNKIGTHMRTSIVDGDLFTFMVSEKIYDVATGKTYDLPLEPTTYVGLMNIMEKIYTIMEKGGDAGQLNFFRINGLKDLGDRFKVIYRDDSFSQYSILVDKQSGKLLQRIKLSDDTRLKYYVFHPKNANQVFRIENRCYYLEEISR